MATDLLAGGAKATWVKLKETGENVGGTVTDVSVRDFHPYDPSRKGPAKEPEVFKSGDVRREILVNFKLDGELFVLPVKESTDLHRKLKAAVAAVDITVGDLPGHEIVVKLTGRDGTGAMAAKIHEVTVSQ